MSSRVAALILGALVCQALTFFAGMWMAEHKMIGVDSNSGGGGGSRVDRKGGLKMLKMLEARRQVKAGTDSLRARRTRGESWEDSLPLHDKGGVFFSLPQNSKTSQILKNRGWRQTKVKSRAEFFWIKNKKDIPWELDGFSNGTRGANHIPGEGKLGNKGALLMSLHKFLGIGKIPFMANSYRLWNDEEAFSFLAATEEEAREESPFQPWIKKITHLDGGKGISFVSSRDSLIKLRSEIRQSRKKFKHLIAQRYIMNPFLLPNKRKFDLRMHWLVASISPLVILSTDGYLRVSSSPYTMANFSDFSAHLTNAEIQVAAKKKQGMKLDKEATRRPVSELLDAIIARGGSERDLHKVQCKIRRALRVVVAAAQKTLLSTAPSKCPACFSLLGADFMLDTDLNVWMSEVQSGPGLPTNTETTANYMWKLLPRAIDIVLEIRKRRRLGKDLWPLDSVGSDGFLQILRHDGPSQAAREAEFQFEQLCPPSWEEKK